MEKPSLSQMIELAKKYLVTKSGSRKQIAERLVKLRDVYLTKKDKLLIIPFLSKKEGDKLLKLKTKKMPKN